MNTCTVNHFDALILIRCSRNVSLRQATHLRHVVEAGEKMTWACIRAFADNTTVKAVLWNSYGASEASSTLWACPRDQALMEDENSSVPIPVGS